jgi:hypothetical protein
MKNSDFYLMVCQWFLISILVPLNDCLISILVPLNDCSRLCYFKHFIIRIMLIFTKLRLGHSLIFHHAIEIYLNLFTVVRLCNP